MTSRLLAVRVNRRALGLVLLSGDQIGFADGRHLTSQADRAVPSVQRFVSRHCEHTRPTALVVDAPPAGSGASTDQAVAAIEATARDLRLPLLRVTRTQVLDAFSVTGLRNRNEVRELVQHYWPDVAARRGAIRPYLLDAAAAALLAECRVALAPPP